jgi:hypothetical protein
MRQLAATLLILIALSALAAADGNSIAARRADHGDIDQLRYRGTERSDLQLRCFEGTRW